MLWNIISKEYGLFFIPLHKNKITPPSPGRGGRGESVHA